MRRGRSGASSISPPSAQPGGGDGAVVAEHRPSEQPFRFEPGTCPRVAHVTYGSRPHRYFVGIRGAFSSEAGGSEMPQVTMALSGLKPQMDLVRALVPTI